MNKRSGRLLQEEAIDDGQTRDSRAPPKRSVTVNKVEPPLGWLLARGHVTLRQFDAGERLRSDWERAQFAPRITMAWNNTPVVRVRGVSGNGPDLTASQIDARERFDAAIASAGPGLADILWRVVCAGDGMPMRRRRSAGPRARASSC